MQIPSNLVLYAKNTVKTEVSTGHQNGVRIMTFWCPEDTSVFTVHKHTSQGFHKSDCYISRIIYRLLLEYVTALLNQLHCFCGS